MKMLIAILLAVALSAIPAASKPVELMCAVPQTSMYFTVTVDEDTGIILFEGLPTTNATIQRDRIIFTMEGRDAPYGYVIDRLTGAMIVVNQKTGASQNSSCRTAKQKF